MTKVSGPAWQLRQGQRQHFVEQWQRRVFHEMEDRENGNFFLLQVLLNLLSYAGLWLQLQEKLVFTVKDIRLGAGLNEATDFVGTFIREAKKFAKVPEEILVLVQEFFQKLEPSLWSTLCSPFQRKELYNTQEVYGVPQSSDEIEVDLEED